MINAPKLTILIKKRRHSRARSRSDVTRLLHHHCNRAKKTQILGRGGYCYLEASAPTAIRVVLRAFYFVYYPCYCA